ncbi:Uncharacterised protein [Vibrio cholerae]|uniref:Uncharacterized protein n=1 Tax=Vibrio cholerae TaxID=666 RepID=A0A655XZG0_VIBCL|nr:Uncharacterised protein [Vibrio cholerae]CSC26716.1 Uncharacterised protein [Vibrio cholerae]
MFSAHFIDKISVKIAGFKHYQFMLKKLGKSKMTTFS